MWERFYKKVVFACRGISRAWQIFKENGGRSTMKWNTFTDVAFMENIQASSYSYVLEEISPIFVETSWI